MKLRRTFDEMAKRFHKFRFNEQSLQMEELPFALRDYLLLGFKKVLFFSCIVAGSIFVFDRYFESPSDRIRERELHFLESQVNRIHGDLDNMGVILEDISSRDDAIYRAIFGSDPYPEHLRNPGVGGSDRTRNLRGYSHSEAVISLGEIRLPT